MFIGKWFSFRSHKYLHLPAAKFCELGKFQLDKKCFKMKHWTVTAFGKEGERNSLGDSVTAFWVFMRMYRPWNVHKVSLKPSIDQGYNASSCTQFIVEILKKVFSYSTWFNACFTPDNINIKKQTLESDLRSRHKQSQNLQTHHRMIRQRDDLKMLGFKVASRPTHLLSPKTLSPDMFMQRDDALGTRPYAILVLGFHYTVSAAAPGKNNPILICNWKTWIHRS